MKFAERTVTCIDCGVSFVTHGHATKRCAACGEIDRKRKASAYPRTIRAIDAARPKFVKECPFYKVRQFPDKVDESLLCISCHKEGFANTCIHRGRCRFVPSDVMHFGRNPCDIRNYDGGVQLVRCFS